MDISEFKQGFIDEASTLLVNLDNSLIELEKNPGDAELANEAYRTMHTIKGAGGMFGFEHVVKITHELESLYDIVLTNKQQVPQALLEVTFAATNHLRAILFDENFTDVKNKECHDLLTESIEKLKKSFALSENEELPHDQAIINNPDADHKVSWNILFYPQNDITKHGANIIYSFQDLLRLGEYQIANAPFKANGKQFWSIILVTCCPYDFIENALMLIMDYCKIIKIADFNVLDPSGFEKINSSPDQESREPDEEDIANGLVSGIEKSESVHPGTILKDLVTSDMQNLVQQGESTQVFSKQKTSSISVDSSKLDLLMYLVSELVTSKSELLISLQKQNIEKAMETAEKIEKLSKSFSENALSIRLVSLHELLNRFKRLVRDLTKQLGKSVDFVTIGEETELDKNVIDNIGEPVMHLIRNCIDHGIESPAKRKEHGKPETGIIKFEAITSGNYVYIFISDDGNGIDTDYVYSKAVEKGFIAPGTTLTHKEILELIFLPGFSTAQSLTNVSGRGVGMDIVLKKIQEMRGEITVTSNFRSGTLFTLKLQQSISIMETLLIEADGITYAIPVEEIESCILEASENILDNQNNLIGHNNSLIPFINLQTIKGSNGHTSSVAVFEKLIIIKRAERVYAIIADKIIGEYQAVIKPLGNAFKNLKFLSGASLLGDGSIALLLDTDKLWYEIPGHHCSEALTVTPDGYESSP